ncbi:MAG: response regulator [Bryobacteraceae bacterium]
MFRLLVVDDNPTIVSLLREALKDLKQRHSIYSVEDGITALDFLSRRALYAHAPRPDLVLLSMNLQHVNGLDILRRIKADPELRNIPVIMMSGAINTSDVRKAYESQANCYVQRPSDFRRTYLLVQAIKALWIDFAIIPQASGHSRLKPVSQEPDSEVAAPPAVRVAGI